MVPLLILCAVLQALLPCATGHGMLISPPPRNSNDRNLPEFKHGKWPLDTDGCNCANSKGGCDAATAREAGGGQACLWFSQGCTIGCDVCDNVTGHTTSPLCKNSTMEPTNNNPATRTVNRFSVAGSSNDTYRYNPWRAPGFAPVTDACGMAGGNPRSGGGAAVFHDTQYAKQGDLGSRVLQPQPSGTVWTAGATVNVSWGIRYNHGGGYQYRLCPASQPLTEACFQKMPLKFVGKPSLLWNNGTAKEYDGVYVTEGTSPKGSAWAMNPIPRIMTGPGPSSGQPSSAIGCHVGAVGNCRAFNPTACTEHATSPWHKIEPVARSTDVEGYCSGDWTGGQLIDQVEIPAGLTGEFVLGWRWDCEETTQVWASCADISIKA